MSIVELASWQTGGFTLARLGVAIHAFLALSKQLGAATLGEDVLFGLGGRIGTNCRFDKVYIKSIYGISDTYVDSS